MKKCGTRALLEFLRLHPNVRAAGSEIHFFDRYYNNGYEWYRRKMPLTNPNQITVEKTPSYWITKEAPQRISKMNQTIKLLIIVRDPVTRAISDYTQSTSKRMGMKKFESMVFINDSSSRIVNRFWTPIKLGIYVKFLKSWLRYFKLSQLLFISGERLILNPAVEMERVQHFLRLQTVIDANYFYFNETKGFPCVRKYFLRNSNYTRCLGKTKGRSHPEINETIIHRLRDFYRPFNEHFFQLVNFDFGWP